MKLFLKASLMLYRVQEFFTWLKAALLLEYEQGRVLLFLPLLQMAGICLYYALPFEPSLLYAFVCFALLILFWVWQRTELSRIIGLLFGFFLLGFSAASLKTSYIDHPILQSETRTVTLKGWVETIERRDENDRVQIKVFEAGNTKLDHVRIVSRVRIKVQVGEAVEVFVRLRPPPEPSRQGSYDFARDSFYRNIGAVGFTLGGFKPTELPPAPWDVWLGAKIENMRQAISQHIRQELKGETGAMADALVTGIRDGLSKNTQENMRRAGTYHILSISGFHMSLVAAFVFGFVRGGLALFPFITLHYPVKRIAGVMCFLAASFYLVLATAEVATLRSYLMIAIILIGVMSNRMSFTLNTLAVTVIIICIVMPDTVLGPSFQMSFGATLVLVAGFARIRLFSEKIGEEKSMLRTVLISVTTGIVGLSVSSFMAGLSTLPYTAFHFNQFQMYGVFGNLLGGPVIEFICMPLEIIALILWPLGLDGWCWPIIGWGIDIFLQSGAWVASWPDSTRAISAFSAASLGIYSLGFILLLILYTRLRWIGAALMVIGIVMSYDYIHPFILRESDGETVAIRNDVGLISALSPKATRFTLEQWQAANGEVIPPNDKTPVRREQGICDQLRCEFNIRGQRIFYLLKEIKQGDCDTADIVITRIRPEFPCKAIIFPLKETPERGGLVLNEKMQLIYAREGERRPWMR